MKKLLVIAAVFAMLLVGAACSVSADVIYSSIPSPYPYNVPSLGYQATQTAEFGNGIGLAGTARNLDKVTVAMSDWAARSDYMIQNGSSWVAKSGFDHVAMNNDGFYHELTFNIYNTDAKSGVGSLITSKTIDAFIKWRPESTSGDGRWLAPDGNTYGGLLSNVVFDFSGNGIVLPNEIIFGLAYNTNTWGAEPIGKHGPYESLNFGLSGGTSVGTDLNADDVYWNTKTAAWYTDGGAAGVGTFRRDTEWTSTGTPAVEFTASSPAVPEPMSILLGIMGLSSVAGFSKLRRK